MALSRGTVTVNDSEVASGSGWALALYNEIRSVELAANPLPSLTPPPTYRGSAAAWRAEVKPIRLRILRGWAREATRHSLLIDHLLGNAQLKVLPSDAGLQRDNTGGNPATLAPTSAVTFGNLL